MTIEISPLGNACNLNCKYCYEHCPPSKSYGKQDIDKLISIGVMESLRTARPNKKQGLSVFGGEPLLNSISDLEKIFKASIGRPGLQTNGTLITEEHIALFKKYKVGVGVSIDGPDELNIYRCDEKTTAKIILNIVELRKAEINVSLIVTVHKQNAGSPEAFALLRAFCLGMESLGIKHIDFHRLVRSSECALPITEATQAFLALAQFTDSRQKMRYQPFVDIRSLLRGNDKDVVCTWHGCDPYCTSAVYGIAADGSVHNCPRMPSYIKCDTSSNLRFHTLSSIDMKHNGCRGCEWVSMCKGGCPAEAIEGDWRNKSEYCETYMALFQYYKKQLSDQGRLPAHPLIRPVKH